MISRMSAANLSSNPTLNPLMWLAAPFAGGIVAARFADVGVAPFLIIGLVSIALCFLLRSRAMPAALLCAAAFVGLGGTAYRLEQFSVRDDRLRTIFDRGQAVSGEPAELTGTVVRGPEPAFNGAFLAVEIERIVFRGEAKPATGRVRMFMPLGSEDVSSELEGMNLRHGTRISVACRPEREDEYLNPGVTMRREMLDRKGVDATCTVKSPLLIEVVDRDGEGIAGSLFEIRRKLIAEMRATFTQRTAGVLIASSLGDKYFLDRETAEIFREGGTFHVLVISGLHITFIGGILLALVRVFTGRRWWQFVITASLLWAYTLAVGAEPPVLRASVMFTVALFGYSVFRSMTLVNALGAGALLLLIYRPSDLFDPSFQLTFASVAGIVCMAFPLIEKLRMIGGWMPDSRQPFPPNAPRPLVRFAETLYWNPRAWEIDQKRQVWSASLFKSPYFEKGRASVRRFLVVVFEGVVVSLVVQIWMLPLMIYYFHRISFASILLNLWVGPLLAAESFAAMAAVTVGAVSKIAALPLVHLTEFLDAAMFSLPQLVVEHWSAGFRLPAFTGDLLWVYAIYFVPLVWLAVVVLRWQPFRLRRYSRVRAALNVLAPSAAILLLAAFMMLAFGNFLRPEPDGRLTVHFLDVGQGDSALVRFPNGETMLIDGGGEFSYEQGDEDAPEFEPDRARIGEMVVSEVLWEMGYSTVDHLVVTHADADHAQGAADVIRNFSVGRLYLGSWPAGESELDEVFEMVSRRGVPVSQVGTGDRLEIGGASVEVLWPAKGNTSSGSDNNSSVVIKIRYGSREFLFTGDIEREAEEALLEYANGLEADVIKAPHHGSRTSSTEQFVHAVKPEMTVIPVGKRSRFGHPHPEVTRRWSESGSSVMTTGERGMVTISTDGTELTVTTFMP